LFVSNGKPGIFDHDEFKESAENDCDNDRQPEIAIWLSKPQIQIFPVWGRIAISGLPLVGHCRNHLGTLSLTSL